VVGVGPYRLGVDITKAFTTKMNDLDVELANSVAKSNKGRHRKKKKTPG